MTEHADERGAEPPAAPRVVMPDWIRGAIAKQGVVDPDEVERLAQLVDPDAPLPGDAPPAVAPKQEPLDLGIPVAPRDVDA